MTLTSKTILALGYNTRRAWSGWEPACAQLVATDKKIRFDRHVSSLTHTLTHPRLNLTKALIVLGLVVSLSILLVLAFLLINPAYAAPATTVPFINNVITKQEKVERDLRAYYQEGKYTFAAPMVIQDPFQAAPLTALVIFDTPTNSQISIHVPGLTPQAAVDGTFAGYQQHHEIPIYGLYAGTLNHVTMRMKTQAGVSAQTTIDLQTEPLPVYLDKITVDQVDPGKYSPGFNLAFLDNKPVFDLDGNVRWYSTQASAKVITPLKNGHFLFTYTIGEVVSNVMMEQDLLGKIYAIYNIAGGIHHDVYELPTGNLLVTSSDLKSNTVNDILLELDRSNGHIVRSFDMKNILDAGRQGQIGGLASNDWLHLNSIVYDSSDHSIIISNRVQCAVVKLSYPGMQIKWILGTHDNWTAKYQPYLLTPVGTNFEWPWGQHHATLFSPDIPGSDTTDILLFDNGLYHSFDIADALPPSKSYSMVVHYRVNEATMTVEEVWEYGKESGPALFSNSLGSAYVLSNSDVLGNWGEIGRDPQGNPVFHSEGNDKDTTRIIEVDPAIQQVVFEATIPNQNYRTLRTGFYDRYSDENAYLSTQLNNAAANDLADRGFLAWQDLKRWSNQVPLILSLKRVVRQILTVLR